MEDKVFLKELCMSHGPSGREDWLHDYVGNVFSEFGEVTSDNLNNLIIHKKGKGKGKIMLMAHLDEVFMVVTSLKENGFLEFKGNGIDPKTLVSKEVVIHGKDKDINGIIGIKPPHLMTEEDKKKATTIESLLIDTGYSKSALEKIIKPGDYITIKGNYKELLNNNISVKTVDDRSGVVALYRCAKELKDINHDLDVYFVCSAQEEVGHRGAKTATNRINPDIGIAVDVTFDCGRYGLKNGDTKLGKGGVICVGPNIHPKVRKRLMNICKEYSIPYQVEVEAGNTGTDAWDIQVAGDGVATLLISIPIKYMHTSVETVNIEDIKNVGYMMAKLIENIKEEDLEGLICF